MENQERIQKIERMLESYATNTESSTKPPTKDTSSISVMSSQSKWSVDSSIKPASSPILSRSTSDDHSSGRHLKVRRSISLTVHPQTQTSPLMPEIQKQLKDLLSQMLPLSTDRRLIQSKDYPIKSSSIHLMHRRQVDQQPGYVRQVEMVKAVDVKPNQSHIQRAITDTPDLVQKACVLAIYEPSRQRCSYPASTMEANIINQLKLPNASKDQSDIFVTNLPDKIEIIELERPKMIIYRMPNIKCMKALPAKLSLEAPVICRSEPKHIEYKSFKKVRRVILLKAVPNYSTMVYAGQIGNQPIIVKQSLYAMKANNVMLDVMQPYYDIVEFVWIGDQSSQESPEYYPPALRRPKKTVVFERSSSFMAAVPTQSRERLVPTNKEPGKKKILLTAIKSVEKLRCQMPSIRRDQKITGRSDFTSDENTLRLFPKDFAKKRTQDTKLPPKVPIVQLSNSTRDPGKKRKVVKRSETNSLPKSEPKRSPSNQQRRVIRATRKLSHTSISVAETQTHKKRKLCDQHKTTP